MQQTLAIAVGERVGSVDAILLAPGQPRFLYILAHGAGAGMQHPFMSRIAQSLHELGVATLRYQFPYMQNRRKSPDVPNVLEATVRAAILAGQAQLPDVPIIAGGKSMGGRMTSQLLSRERNLPVRGIAFLGFPLHQPNKPGKARAAHLSDVQQPMLFLQGTRDALANLGLMQELTHELGARARLHVIEGADHSFAVPKRSGRTQEEVLQELAATLLEWAVQL